jgi:hypothetical protein
MSTMMTGQVTFLSQSVDYLGFLEAKLRDLRGIATLVHELLQNADDVHGEDGKPAATRITFDVCDDALIVENDGVPARRVTRGAAHAPCRPAAGVRCAGDATVHHPSRVRPTRCDAFGVE